MTPAFTGLEQDILHWIAERAAPRLAIQLRAARFAGRSHSGVGLFVDLAVPSELVSPWFLKSAHTVNGPEIRSPVLRHGAGTIVLFEQGLPSGLEVFTYDEPFPEELPNYVLNATHLTSAANLNYDEDDELVRSILLYQRELLTDPEKLALRALEAHERAKLTDSERMRRALIDRWGNRGLPGVDAALEQGYEAFSIAVVRRVLREASADVVLNRCPRCDRIPRTPMAKQCRWCHHDWHAAVEDAR
jgi:hypothetical protein